MMSEAFFNVANAAFSGKLQRPNGKKNQVGSPSRASLRRLPNSLRQVRFTSSYIFMYVYTYTYYIYIQCLVAGVMCTYFCSLRDFLVILTWKKKVHY
jgi:hypothetical protein